MMEDWTDIIGEELENIEEPLPADDWSVLQQKYAAAQKRKKAAAFAWAGGITSVAAAAALVLLLVRPDSSSVIPGSTGELNNFVAETLPPTEDVVPVDSSVIESPIDTALNAAPSVQKKVTVPIDVVKKTADDALLAENQTEEIPSENTEDVFDVIRDTTSLKDKLLADASTTNKKDSSEDAYTLPTGTFGFEDFPEDEPRRKRRPVSIGLSGAASAGSLSFIKLDADLSAPMAPTPEEAPQDTTIHDASQPSMAMKKARSGYSDSYNHELPVSFGLSARIFLTDRLTINTGLNYTKYTSLRSRFSYETYDTHKDWQYAHYLGIPIRIDLMAVNKKHFNFYLGAGVQADKCVYAIVGDERLHEKEILFSLNGSMGIQVNIIPMVGLYLEPEISYTLNEGRIETFRSKEPYMFTIRAGMRFNF